MTRLFRCVFIPVDTRLSFQHYSTIRYTDRQIIECAFIVLFWFAGKVPQEGYDANGKFIEYFDGVARFGDYYG